MIFFLLLGAAAGLYGAGYRLGRRKFSVAGASLLGIAFGVLTVQMRARGVWTMTEEPVSSAEIFYRIAWGLGVFYGLSLAAHPRDLLGLGFWVAVAMAGWKGGGDLIHWAGWVGPSQTESLMFSWAWRWGIWAGAAGTLSVLAAGVVFVCGRKPNLPVEKERRMRILGRYARQAAVTALLFSAAALAFR